MLSVIHEHYMLSNTLPAANEQYLASSLLQQKQFFLGIPFSTGNKAHEIYGDSKPQLFVS